MIKIHNIYLAKILKRFGSPDIIGVLVRGVVIASLLQIAGNGIGYIGQILLARWLGARYYGVYSFLLSWAQVLTIGALIGMNMSILRFVPEYILRQDRPRLRGILRWSRRLIAITGVGLATASILALIVIRPIQFSSAAILWGSLLIPLFALSEIQMEIIRSIKWIAWAYGPPILLQPLLLIGLTYLILRILSEGTDYVILLALILSIGCVLLIQAVVIHKAFSASAQNVPLAYDAKRWLAVSLPLLFNSIFSIVLLRVDTLVVGFLMGPEEVGIYNAAVKTATVIGLTLPAANTILAPMITTYSTRRDMASLQNIVSLATLSSFCASILFGSGVIALSRPLLLTFGTDFYRAQWPLIILIASQWINVGTGSVSLLMILTGFERQIMWITGICALAAGCLCFLLIPFFGITGAAIASSISLLGWDLWASWQVKRKFGIRPSIFFALKKFFSATEKATHVA